MKKENASYREIRKIVNAHFTRKRSFVEHKLTNSRELADLEQEHKKLLSENLLEQLLHAVKWRLSPNSSSSTYTESDILLEKLGLATYVYDYTIDDYPDWDMSQSYYRCFPTGEGKVLYEKIFGGKKNDKSTLHRKF